MAIPRIGPTGTLIASIGAANAGGTTTAFAVGAGDSVYVLIGYDAGGAGTITVSGVTDAVLNPYTLVGRIRNTTSGAAGVNPCVDIWRADNVLLWPALTVTVSFSANTVYAVIAADISGTYGAGSVDLVTVGSIGSPPSSNTNKVTTSSDSIAPILPNDLLLAVQCTERPSGAMTSGGGFSATIPPLPSGPTVGAFPFNDIILDAFVLDPANPPTTYNSSLSWGTASYYALITVAIRSPIPSASISGKASITVSPNGIFNSLSPLFNGGADFGPDTPGTTTVGIQEAVNSLAAGGGGTISLLPGTYPMGNVVGINVSNLTLVIDPNAILQLPANPSWTVMTSPTVSRSPLITVSGANNVSIVGGQFIMLTPATSTVGTGIHIGHGCKHIRVRGGFFQSLSRFAVLSTGYDNFQSSGTGAPTQDVTVENCWMDSCGTAGTTNDGGGIRFSNAIAPNASTATGFYALRNMITNSFMFGVDVNNPSSDSSPMARIVIAFNEILFASAAGAQAIGILLEESMANIVFNTTEVMVEQNHVTGGLHGLQIQGGVQQVVVLGGIYEGSKQAPVVLTAPNSGTVLSDVILDSVIAKSGGQSLAMNNGGIEISSQTSSDSGMVQNVQITNCRCFDDQPTKTQAYGLYFRNITAANLIVSGIIVEGGRFDGNTTGEIGFNVTMGTFAHPMFRVLIAGGDSRLGVSTPDTAALTLWTPLSNATYRFTLYLNATSWTSGTATYTITYKLRDGTTKTATATASAADQNVSSTFVASVEGTKAITGRLTGTFTMNVDILVTFTQLA